MEKCQHSMAHVEQFKNGVLLSKWQEVLGRLSDKTGRPFKVLKVDKIRDPAPTVKDLRDAVVVCGLRWFSVSQAFLV